MKGRSFARRDDHAVSVSAAVRAVLGACPGRLKTAADSVRSDGMRLGCAVGAAVLLVLSLVLPGLIYRGGGCDINLLYASAGLFFTVLFSAMSLCRFGGRASVDPMFFAPFPPFVLLLVRSTRELLPMMLKAFSLLVLSFGTVRALFDVGARFFVMCIFGFAVTAALGILMFTALRTLEVIFGFRSAAVRLVFAVLLVLWVAMAVVLTPPPYSGGIGRFCAALVSPVGTTIPVGGWLCAVIMGICEGSVGAAVPGVLLCPAFGAVLIMILCVMNGSQYDLAVSALLDGERKSVLAERIGGLALSISYGVSSRIAEIGGGEKNSELTPLSLFKAELCRVITERGHGLWRRFATSVDIAVVCLLLAALCGSALDARFVVFAVGSLFVALRLSVSDLRSPFNGSGVSCAALAVYELGGCVVSAVCSVLPAAVVCGASGAAATVAVVLAVAAVCAGAFGVRLVRR